MKGVAQFSHAAHSTCVAKTTRREGKFAKEDGGNNRTEKEGRLLRARPAVNKGQTAYSTQLSIFDYSISRDTPLSRPGNNRPFARQRGERNGPNGAACLTSGVSRKRAANKTCGVQLRNCRKLAPWKRAPPGHSKRRFSSTPATYSPCSIRLRI